MTYWPIDWPSRKGIVVVVVVVVVVVIVTSRFACLRCAACERYAFAGSPSGVSKNYASRLADLSRPSGSSSTIYKTKIESSNCIG